MPFGKYRGWPLDAVPEFYLRWAVENLRNIDLHLRRALREALAEHEAAQAHQADRSQRAPTGGALIDLPALIKTWHREMALRFHPDRGGSHEAMVAISIAHDRLKGLAGVN
jgi:uncharacterized protein (DUF3820 family)